MWRCKYTSLVLKETSYNSLSNGLGNFRQGAMFSKIFIKTNNALDILLFKISSLIQRSHLELKQTKNVRNTLQG